MKLTIISFRHPHESISRRARELWLRLGSPADQDLAIWLQAERELNGPPADPCRSIDAAELEEAFESFGVPRGRSPTSLDLT